MCFIDIGYSDYVISEKGSRLVIAISDKFVNRSKYAFKFLQKHILRCRVGV